MKHPSGGRRGGARKAGAAGKGADMDAVEPGAGAGGGIAVAKLLAELHPEASEDVPALVAVGDGPCAPPGVARRDLDDGPVAGVGEHRIGRGRVRLALHTQHPAHDVDALRVPAGVDAETRRAPDGCGLPRRRRLGDALLDVGAHCELASLVQGLGRGERRVRPGEGRQFCGYSVEFGRTIYKPGAERAKLPVCRGLAASILWRGRHDHAGRRTGPGLRERTARFG